MHAWYLIVQKTIYFYEIIPTGITKGRKLVKNWLKLAQNYFFQLSAMNVAAFGPLKATNLNHKVDFGFR